MSLCSVRANDLEPVEVEALFDEKGGITPLRFRREGRSYQIDNVGRQWEDDAGKHFIISLPVEKVMELLYSTATSRWYLKQVGFTHRYG